MKVYRVISLAVGGLGNKIFKSGDIVNEKNFPKGNAPILEQKGYLKFLKEVDDKGTDQGPTAEEPEFISTEELEAMAKTKEDELEPAKEPGDPVEGKTLNELRAEAKERGLGIPKNATKEVLINLLSQSV